MIQECLYTSPEGNLWMLKVFPVFFFTEAPSWLEPVFCLPLEKM